MCGPFWQSARVRISEALGQPADLAVHFDGGGVLNVTYRPTNYTVAQIEEIQASSQKDPKRIIEAVMRTVIKWDLIDDDGVPVPLEFEVLRQKVPTPIFRRIFDAVNEDQTPEGKES